MQTVNIPDFLLSLICGFNVKNISVGRCLKRACCTRRPIKYNVCRSTDCIRCEAVRMRYLRNKTVGSPASCSPVCARLLSIRSVTVAGSASGRPGSMYRRGAAICTHIRHRRTQPSQTGFVTVVAPMLQEVLHIVPLRCEASGWHLPVRHKKMPPT